MTAIHITHCPTCGSRDIHRVTRTVTGRVGAHTYRAPRVTFEECLNCGEKLYDRDAMQKVSAARAHATLSAAPRKPSRRRAPA